jgi:hypothetical protein
LLVKSTLNQPSFGGGSFVHSCPSPHSTNIWGYFVGKFYPNLFFLDRFDCDFSACVLNLGLIHCWTLPLPHFYYGMGLIGPVRNIIFIHIWSVFSNINSHNRWIK